MRLVGETVAQRTDVLCPPGSWPAETWRWPAWRQAVHQQRMQRAIYAEVVARWNAWLARAPAELELAPSDYFDYLMNVYGALDRLDSQQGAAIVEAATAGWGSLPSPDASGAVRIEAGQLPWFDYLLRVRAVIDDYFPQLDPLPILAIGSTYAPSRGAGDNVSASRQMDGR